MHLSLLYSLLVKSSNEAANVLAEYVSGNVESFVTLMNTKAAELGCQNTHFVNPNGVHNEEHYSTAYDLSLITKAAMKNTTFRKMVATASYTLPSTNKYDRIDRNLINTNDLIRKNSKYYYEYAIGVKTGYTSQAKNCLVAAANKDGIELISVLLCAEKLNSNNQSERDIDAKNLFEYVYNNFSKKTVLEENSVVKTITVKDATKETEMLKLIADRQVEALVTNDKLKTIEEPTFILREELEAPISKGEIVGTLKYKIDGLEYNVNLIAGNNVEKSYMKWIIAIAIIIIGFLLLGINNRKKQLKKKTVKK